MRSTFKSKYAFTHVFSEKKERKNEKHDHADYYELWVNARQDKHATFLTPLNNCAN